ncbi:hypothetical protein CXB51_005976 [Gossypium anomalum]|uniref:Protein kinase domain-containing protein n=1 Tax=Gossypium anomalum TaxID=47600 RepID=A0A8J5ZCM1_9ROSI|nr:hypothetical protein CXB51_005976 [Gossypium anomalum]
MEKTIKSFKHSTVYQVQIITIVTFGNGYGGWNSTVVLFSWAWFLAAASASVASHSQALPALYPFGMNQCCYLSKNFSIYCNQSFRPLDHNNYMGLLRGLSQKCGTVILLAAGFHVHYLNKFTAVGCDTCATIMAEREDTDTQYYTGCMSYYDKKENPLMVLAPIFIPSGLKNLNVSVTSFNNHTNVWDFNPCSYTFVADESSVSAIKNLFLWCLIGRLELNILVNKIAYAMILKTGLVISASARTATVETRIFSMVAKILMSAKIQASTIVCCLIVATGLSVLVAIMGSSWLFFIRKKRKLLNMKKKFFWRNGGLLVKELKNTTKNYDESHIIGKEGFGTFYKDIKKSEIVDKSQINQFINEVIILSQINNRNVVKLLGCCLETEVLLLVYEFVSNGTLYEHIHYENKASSISWEIRLRVATKSAQVLSYLHYTASTPIIHRDMKPANIFQDENYIAKFSDLTIPYPFGTMEGCYLNKNFYINCTETANSFKAYLAYTDFIVTDITMEGRLQILTTVARDCYSAPRIPVMRVPQIISLSPFSIYNLIALTAMSMCRILILAAMLLLLKKVDFSSLRYISEDYKFPVSLDWVVSNETCVEAAKNPLNYACHRSECHEPETGSGYLCKCPDGFYGNPYLPEGCLDIDECKIWSHCDKNAICRNLPGSFKCICKGGYEGDGKRNGTGCSPVDAPDGFPFVNIGLGVSISLLVFVLSISWIYWGLWQRKLIRQRENFFLQNGGIILQQEFSKLKGSVSAKIFTSKELKKATNNFHETRILGKGGHGTVYKGILQDNRVVAIKKSMIADHSQVEQFVNEVIVLSQVNHRDVVKLLGCCLETEVPLLVYEFISNGTLHQRLHCSGKGYLSWEYRLRIAAETAGALSYLHSAAYPPIIHRDVKSTNILLDEHYTAKVSDFGASRLVPLDQTQLTTLVQGTLGYLDPEYFQSSQLTEKSDVYSFGVVLAELLTKRKALCFQMPEEERNLAMHFVSALKKGQLFGIIDHQVLVEGSTTQIKEVAMLANRCLRVRGEERPSMKEVAMELEGLRSNPKHPWVKDESKETENLLSEPSGANAHGNDGSPSDYDSGRQQIILQGR